MKLPRLRRPEAAPTDPRAEQRQRFARRRWQRRWLTWKHGLSVVAALALVCGGVWLVFFSSQLALKKVTVTGTSYLSHAAVVDAAGLPMGRPLARLDLSAAQDTVSALGAVKSVDITREWPSSVRIQVTERQAVAVVQTGQLIRGLDAEGLLFREYATRPSNLPLVQANVVDTDARALAEAATVASALPSDLNRRMRLLTVDSVDSITLQMKNGKQVFWGSADDSELKADVLVALLKQPGRVYDVSAPSLPTVRD